MPLDKSILRKLPVRLARNSLLTAVVMGAVLVCSCGQRPGKVVSEGTKISSDANRAVAGNTEMTAADNSRCYVCHANFAGEKLSDVHAQVGVGCEKCHGMSDAHCADEDNVTAPEIMYAKEKIDSTCMSCHVQRSIDSEPHRGPLAGAATDKKCCTDCHGSHRMNHRTRRWDKSTGRLIADDKVRMMTGDMVK